MQRNSWTIKKNTVYQKQGHFSNCRHVVTYVYYAEAEENNSAKDAE